MNAADAEEEEEEEELPVLLVKLLLNAHNDGTEVAGITLFLYAPDRLPTNKHFG